MSMAVLATACGKEEVNTAESQTQITEEASTEALQTQTSEEITGEAFMPNGFIEEKAQKNEFDSYEEVIGYLEAGQAYTYVDVLGVRSPYYWLQRVHMIIRMEKMMQFLFQHMYIWRMKMV